MYWQMMSGVGRVGELPADADLLPHAPSIYFHRNCWMGASMPSPDEAEAIKVLGVDRVMWGSDYPHKEGTYPYSLEALQHSFCDWDEADLRLLLAGTAAEIYDLDLDMLDALEIGPMVADVATPLRSEEHTSELQSH